MGTLDYDVQPSQLILKADVNYVDSQLALKANLNAPTFIGSVSLPNTTLFNGTLLSQQLSPFSSRQHQNSATQTITSGLNAFVVFSPTINQISVNNPPIIYNTVTNRFTFSRVCTMTVSYSLRLTTVANGAIFSSYFAIFGDNLIGASGPFLRNTSTSVIFLNGTIMLRVSNITTDFLELWISSNIGVGFLEPSHAKIMFAVHN